MYKIKFLTTGHVFLLPEKEAKDLKERFPDEYKILEKDGKKYYDRRMKKKKEIDLSDIREFVIDER